MSCSRKIPQILIFKGIFSLFFSQRRGGAKDTKVRGKKVRKERREEKREEVKGKKG
jgi:hypothetical protein